MHANQCLIWIRQWCWLTINIFFVVDSQPMKNSHSIKAIYPHWTTTSTWSGTNSSRVLMDDAEVFWWTSRQTNFVVFHGDNDDWVSEISCWKLCSGLYSLRDTIHWSTKAPIYKGRRTSKVWYGSYNGLKFPVSMDHVLLLTRNGKTEAVNVCPTRETAENSFPYQHETIDVKQYICLIVKGKTRRLLSKYEN